MVKCTIRNVAVVLGVLGMLGGCRPAPADEPSPPESVVEPPPSSEPASVDVDPEDEATEGDARGSTSPGAEGEAEPAGADGPESTALYRQSRCPACDSPELCVHRRGDAADAVLGCGVVDGTGDVAIIEVALETPGEDFLGMRYDFWGPEGTQTRDWVPCEVGGAGCTARFTFFDDVPGLASYVYGGTGGGGERNGLVDVSTGRRYPLAASGELELVRSPDGKRLAYHDVYDPIAGTVGGGVYCYDLHTHKEKRLARGKALGVKVRPDDTLVLTWEDDARIRLELRRPDEDDDEAPETTVWSKSFRCPG